MLSMNLDTSRIPRVAHIGEYFGPWAIQEAPFTALFNSIKSIDLTAHIKAQQAIQPQATLHDDEPGFIRSQGGVAIVELIGPLMKFASSLSGGTSTVSARRAIRNAANDESISSILILIDSPGGTVAGTEDLADDVAAAAQQKTVHAFIQDLGASSAFRIASSATKIFANQGALIGAMGTFLVVTDFSQHAENEGVKVIVVKAGEFKGMGEPGTPITEDHIKELQIVVDDLNDQFIRGVSKGRGLSIAEVKQLADGRVHIASKAKGLKLINGVESLDVTLARLSKSSTGRNKPMSEAANVTAESTDAQKTAGQGAGLAPPPLNPVAAQIGQVISTGASFDEIQAACVGADADFLVAQLAAKATVEQATAAWMAEQNKRLIESKKETAAAKATVTKPGVPALSENGQSQLDIGSDAQAQWDEKIEAALKSPQCRTRADASRKVNREHPELREAVVAQANENRPARR